MQLLLTVIVAAITSLLTQIGFSQRVQSNYLDCTTQEMDTLSELFNNAFQNHMLHVKELDDDSLINMFKTSRLFTPVQHIDQTFKALSYFPELFDDRITFKYRRIHCTMNARPDLLNIFRKRQDRKYMILVNNNKGKNKGVNCSKISFNGLVGWYGHELGHVCKYHEMTNWQIIKFSLKYIASRKYVRNIERNIDAFAIMRGLAFEIYESEQILKNDEFISDEYRKNSISNLLTDQELIYLWHLSNTLNHTLIYYP